VNSDKLRFDFTHGGALTEEEIKKIETWVNEAVLESSAVCASQQNYEQAMRSGTLAFFGDKYGDQVRVLEIPGRSKELCGGTHCHQTGEIGAFVITSETSIGSGTRRIEALTGLNAVHYLKDLQKTVNQISSLLKVGTEQVTERIEKLQKRVRELEQTSGKKETKNIDVEALIQNGKTIGGIKLITQTATDQTLDFLRQLTDQVRSKAKQSVIILFSTDESKVNVIVSLTKDLAHSALDAKQLAQIAAPLLDGSAGGRKDMAQGGGRNKDGIEAALKAVTRELQKTA
jgi:alanyl-tRNA synthetase